MQALTHAQAAATGQLHTSAAQAGRIARLAEHRAARDQQLQARNEGMHLLRGSVRSIEHVADVLDMLACALGMNPKPLNTPVADTRQTLEELADHLRYEVLG